jgi:hypothetical protein
MADEIERRLLAGIYLQLSLMNRSDPNTAVPARAIDDYVREWLQPPDRAVMDRLLKQA